MQRTRILMIVYIACAAMVLVWALVQVETVQLPQMAEFLAVALVLSCWQIRLGDSAVLPISTPITAAAQLILPTHLAVLMDACVGLTVAFRRQATNTLSILFNLANVVLPAFIAGTLLTFTGYRGHSEASLMSIIVACTVLLVRYLMNILPGSLFVASRDGRAINDVLTDLLQADGWGGPSSILMAVLIMLSYPHVGSASLLLASGVVFTTRQSVQLYAQRELLTIMAHFDALTKVGNRHAWHDTLENLQKNPNPPYNVALFDLNGLKAANDAFGHEMGDFILKSFASRLSYAVGKENVFRFGGDEFVVLLSANDKRSHDFQNILHNVAEVFEEEWLAKGLNVSASVGCAVANSNKEIASALRLADTAMYHQKRQSVHSQE